MIFNHIMFITHDMHGGGCERVISNLSNWFIKKGLKVTIITEYKSVPFYDLNNQVEIVSLDPSSMFRRKSIVPGYYKFRKIVKKMKPDIIVAMPEKVNVWAVLALIGMRLPIIVSERNNPRYYPQSRIKRVLRKVLYPLRCNGFIFQTKDAANFFSKSIQKRAIILPNPLDLDKIPQKQFDKRRNEIVAIGRLENQKNFHLLINAFSEFIKLHNSYILTIYGEGSLREELEKHIKEKLLSDVVHLPGKMSDVLEKIAGAKMFVMSSNYEGFPNALIEAMAVGLPVISTDCPIGGPKEIIKHQINGILVPIKSVADLKNGMLKIANNENLAIKLAENALKIKDELDINVIGEKWLKYLEKIYLKLE